MVEEVNVRVLVVQPVDVVRVRVVLHGRIEILGAETLASPEACAQNDIRTATEGKGIARHPISQSR